MVYVDTLREDEGGTYGASVVSRSRKNPRGRYMLQVVFDTQPEKADNLRKVAGEQLCKLAVEGPTADYFARTVEHFNKALAERRVENGFWYGRLLNWYQEEINLLEDYEQAIKDLTPEKVKAAAKALLDSGNLIDVVMQPQP
jgi:zinc protease